VVTLEENTRAGGFGEAVRNALHERGLQEVSHSLLSLPDRFVEHGAQPLIREECGLDADSVVQAVMRMQAGQFKR
jgi:1-deoxy-D-xylulose-5-phosphate synthase